MGRFFGFLFEHFWKLLSAITILAFTTFVAMVQSPREVQARVSELESHYQTLNNSNMDLQARIGASDILFNRVDTKLNTLNDNLIILSQEVRRLNNKP